MDADALYRRYEELQQYLGWKDADAELIQSIAGILQPHLPALVDDFYAEIDRHPEARKVITGGPAQVERLKVTLVAWLRELLSGVYDRDYVSRRWRVGWRHVEIGLDQVYTNVALSRLRQGLVAVLTQNAPTELHDVPAIRKAINTLLDLDLAIIEDAYQTEYMLRQQRTERLAAIGQVAGGIAHELRNPLNVIKTSVYFLLNARNASPTKVAEHLQRIEKHVLVADGVITALSNFAKLPIPNLRPVRVEGCVREILDLNPLPENIVAVLEMPPDLPAALADYDQLRIVLSNLIRNAREAMPQGGRLTIRAQATGAALEINVADTGVGIPSEQLQRIMEPLYSTKARGLGLGLAIARAILEKTRGSLRVTSAPGQGSTFNLQLPAVGNAETSAVPAEGH